jgi:demethylspheroidene O-methyltransferase
MMIVRGADMASQLLLAETEYVQQTGQMQSLNQMDNLGWRGRWIDWRNRLFTSPQFRRLALSNPFLRPVSRTKAESLFNLINGFVFSQIVLACVRTGLVKRLAAGPLSVEEAATLADLPIDAADRLLKGAAAIDIAERLADGRYMLGEQGASLQGSPGLEAMIEHHALLYADLVDPVAMLRAGKGQGQLAAYWAYGAGQDATTDAVTPYSGLMTATQAMVVEQVLGAYDFRGVSRLLDVGGGSGAFVRAVTAAHPRLETAVFDLPAVAARAPAGLTAYGGNFFEDALPQGFDLISLVRIMHDHDDEPVIKLLRNIAAALPKDGKLLIAEPMAETRGARAMGDAYFGLYLWAMGTGRPRNMEENCAMLRAAGLGNIRILRTTLPLAARVIIAGHSAL